MKDENDIVSIVVKDANIIFDFWDLGLMDSFLKVDYKIYVTGLVQREIEDAHQQVLFRSYVDAHLILIDNGELDDILDLVSMNAGCSIEDCSVLEFGIRTGSTILTNDGKLKDAIGRNGLIGHGLLWCIEDLVDKGIISWKVGKEKIELWMTINERTPKELCEKIILKLEKNYSSK